MPPIFPLSQINHRNHRQCQILYCVLHIFSTCIKRWKFWPLMLFVKRENSIFKSKKKKLCAVVILQCTGKLKWRKKTSNSSSSFFLIIHRSMEWNQRNENISMNWSSSYWDWTMIMMMENEERIIHPYGTHSLFYLCLFTFFFISIFYLLYSPEIYTHIYVVYDDHYTMIYYFDFLSLFLSTFQPKSRKVYILRVLLCVCVICQVNFSPFPSLSSSSFFLHFGIMFPKKKNSFHQSYSIHFFSTNIHFLLLLFFVAHFFFLVQCCFIVQHYFHFDWKPWKKTN